jgi:hypothetical protein
MIGRTLYNLVGTSNIGASFLNALSVVKDYFVDESGNYLVDESGNNLYFT